MDFEYMCPGFESRESHDFFCHYYYSAKDKVHEGTKSALLQKLMKFGNIVCVCLR